MLTLHRGGGTAFVLECLVDLLLRQKFASVYGKTKAVHVNPSLSARFLESVRRITCFESRWLS